MDDQNYSERKKADVEAVFVSPISPEVRARMLEQEENERSRLNRTSILDSRNFYPLPRSFHVD